MKLNNNARILIISDKDYFPYLFSYKNKHPELNIKIINRNALLDKLAYRFTSDPIPYLIKEKGISYSKAKRYVNLLRLDVHQNNPKLNSLYSDISSMLIKDEYGLYELEQYEIYLFEMDEDRDVIHLLNNNKLAYTSLKFPDLEEDTSIEYQHPKVIYFSDKFAQYTYIFSDIRKRLIDDPSLKDRFVILIKNEQDIFYIKTLANLFSLDVFAVIRSPLISDVDISKKVNEIFNLRKYEFKDEELEKEGIYTLFNIIKQYHLDELDDFDYSYANLMEILSSMQFDTVASNKGIIITDQYVFDHSKIIYITNFEYGSFYKEYSDNNVLTDVELSSLDVSTSYHKTALDKRKKENYLKYNHIALYSRIKQHLSDSIHDSRFATDPTFTFKAMIIENDKVEEYNKNGLYTSKMSTLLKAHRYDQIFYQGNDNGYKTYDHQYKGIKANELTNKKRWSITNIEKYYDCPFKYYLDTLIPLDGDMHHAFRGTLVHSVLEDIYHEDFDFEKSFNRGKEAYINHVNKSEQSFTKKDEAFIDLYHHWLKEIIPTLLRQKEYMHLIENDNDHEIPVEFKIDKYNFKGFIDKIIYTEYQGQTYYTIVDYKTGAEDFDPVTLPVGKSIQLPLYYWAKKDAFENKGMIFGGFMIQHPFFSSIKKAFVDSNVFSEANLIDSLKYSGPKLNKEYYYRSFDETAFVGDSLDKKGGYFLDTKMSFPSIDGEYSLLDEKKYSPKHFNINDIVELSKEITKLIIEKIINNDFPIRPSQNDIEKPLSSNSTFKCAYCNHRNICYCNMNRDTYDYSGLIEEVLRKYEG